MPDTSEDPNTGDGLTQDVIIHAEVLESRQKVRVILARMFDRPLDFRRMTHPLALAMDTVAMAFLTGAVFVIKAFHDGAVDRFGGESLVLETLTGAALGIAIYMLHTIMLVYYLPSLTCHASRRAGSSSLAGIPLLALPFIALAAPGMLDGVTITPECVAILIGVFLLVSGLGRTPALRGSAGELRIIHIERMQAIGEMPTIPVRAIQVSGEAAMIGWGLLWILQ